MKKIYKGNDRRKKRRLMRTDINCEAEFHEAEVFGFEPGPEFTLHEFQKYADNFKAQYFGINGEIKNDGGKLTRIQNELEPSVEDIEGEYWQIVGKPTEEIKV